MRFLTFNLRTLAALPIAAVLALGIGAPAAHADDYSRMNATELEQAVLRAQMPKTLGSWSQNYYFSENDARFTRPTLCWNRSGDVKLPNSKNMGSVGYAVGSNGSSSVTIYQYADQAKDVDIVITTALIPGRPAPRLLTAEMVASMKPGSVVVDLAAANGGNVEGSVPDEVVVTPNGVTIIGYTDLAGRLPAQASQLYSTTLVNLMKLLTPGKDGELVLNWDDVVQRSMTVAREGAVTWPPPPVEVSAAPQAAAQPAAAPAKQEKQPTSLRKRFTLVGLAAAALLLITAAAPAQLTANITVFVLAIVIGFYVIGNVHHALHTPLMSITNAISGIIVVGALLQIGTGDTAVTILAFIAVLVASINIFGGFAVTRRMLEMFQR